MRAVEAGAKEWHEAQMKLRARRDAMRAQAERVDPRNLLSRAKADNVDIEIDHGHDRDRRTFGIVIVHVTLRLPVKCFRSNIVVEQSNVFFFK